MLNFTLPQGDLLVAPEQVSQVESILTQLAADSFAGTFNQKVMAAVSEDFWDEEMSWVRPYNVENGVLTVPVRGMLMDGFPYQYRSLATGYEYIEAAVARGVNDPAVREVVLHIDSPGGTVTGCFDCTDADYSALITYMSTPAK